MSGLCTKQAKQAANIANEISRYNLTLLGLSETRWTQSGTTRLHSGELNNIYSGHMEEDVPHSEGVAFMVSRTEEGALLDREPSFLLQDYYGHFSHKSKEN